MQLLPSGRGVSAVKERDMPSRTYRLDLGSGRVRGWVDGREALEQAVTLRLLSWWRSHRIFDDRYGFEGQGLIGRDKGYVRSELKRRLRECLLEDERIYGVENFGFSEGEQGEGYLLSFTLRSRYGEWEMKGLEVLGR